MPIYIEGVLPNRVPAMSRVWGISAGDIVEIENSAIQAKGGG
jgi:hypothetical protein